MFKHRLALALLLLSMVILQACGGTTGSTSPTATAVTGGQASSGSADATATTGTASSSGSTASGEKFKVAFVYVGPRGDEGWTWAHDQGRLELEKNLPNVETMYQENVPENAADAERVIRDFAQKGAKLIVTTSFGYMDPTINVAKDFPNVQFIHISGYKTAPNVSTGFGKIEEPRYVAGMIAGKMTKTNTLGYVAAFPIPEVIRGINAFTLGVQKTNPSAKVKVVWTSTWFDPQKERSAAEALLDSGADVIAQHQDTPGPQQAAQDKGKYGVGYDSDMSKSAPKAVLTSPIWHWGIYYTDAVKQIMAGTWKTNQFWGGWKEGLVDLAPIGPMVPDDVKKLAEDEIAKFKSGSEDIFNIFAGPLKDQTGAEKVPTGKSMTGDEILSMDWFVQGVEGTIQK